MEDCDSRRFVEGYLRAAYAGETWTRGIMNFSAGAVFGLGVQEVVLGVFKLCRTLWE